MADEHNKEEPIIVHDRRVHLDDEPQQAAPEQSEAQPAEEPLTIHDRRVQVDDLDSEPEETDSAETIEDDPREDPARTCGMPTMPEATFATFVISLSSTCLMHLGEVPNPDNQASCVDLSMAKHIIDTLAMLQTKTTGNLDGDEQRLLEGVLYELRMKFVMRKS